MPDFPPFFILQGDGCFIGSRKLVPRFDKLEGEKGNFNESDDFYTVHVDRM